MEWGDSRLVFALIHQDPIIRTTFFLFLPPNLVSGRLLHSNKKTLEDIASCKGGRQPEISESRQKQHSRQLPHTKELYFALPLFFFSFKTVTSLRLSHSKSLKLAVDDKKGNLPTVEREGLNLLSMTETLWTCTPPLVDRGKAQTIH